MLLADVICQGCDGYNAFVTDVIVTCIAVADGNHIYLADVILMLY